MMMHDVFHVTLLRPYKKGGGPANAPLPAILSTGDTEFEVEEIFGHEDDVTMT